MAVFDYDGYSNRLEDLFNRLGNAGLRVQNTRLDAYRKAIARISMNKSAPEKRHANGTTYPKSDLRYWRTRIYKPVNSRGIESNHYMVKLQHLSRRQAFSLHTASAEEAALKAKAMYQKLVANGWASLLHNVRPTPPPASGLTFGGYVALVRSKNLIPEKTLGGYLQRLRRIVTEIKDINRNGKRHRPGSKGRAEVIAKIEAVPGEAQPKKRGRPKKAPGAEPAAAATAK
ncbi:MAG: hypothetical protein C5B58_05725 [Acidobacteria bacterium]|nr:MAG: hypothetical protein C5B58_05725 [Acidobacteriota bacterium]